MKIPGSVTGSGSQEYWSYLSSGGIRHGALPMMNLTTTLCKFQHNKIQRVDNNKLDKKVEFDRPGERSPE